MRIIAFSGPKSSGKDTAARTLLGLNLIEGRLLFQQMNFADPLKAACKNVFGLTDQEMNDPQMKEKVLDRWPYKSPRELMQHFALNCRTIYGPDIWVQRWIQRLPEITAPCIIVTDLRHPEELVIKMDYQAKIVYVQNDSVEQVMREAQLAATSAPDQQGQGERNHWKDPSESFYDMMRVQADTTVLNNGTIDALHNQVQLKIIELLGSWKDWPAPAPILPEIIQTTILNPNSNSKA